MSLFTSIYPLFIAACHLFLSLPPPPFPILFPTLATLFLRRMILAFLCDLSGPVNSDTFVTWTILTQLLCLSSFVL
ncbi:uncharacterized protein EI90DRAFT_3082659 [Cantharellus anzutake]|uniref:uncharacterized protein n=1 Tax=Cantharellus anzutake TaxID=1750568 RepID=UPI001903130A|nr:uncharacterized protein EI90DRAFT_3082659 [Cantharellus anzutake]KAF8318915.1 hypothetical protein EI90DRAFT_3082659 [Cantharellus anzutake]